MFIGKNRREVTQDSILHWTMQGRPGRNAGLRFSLQIHYVHLPNGETGILLNPHGTQLPDGIEVRGMQPFDTLSFNGQTVWLRYLNGMVVVFEGDDYGIIQIKEVKDDLSGGILYFHTYPPEEFEGGELVYNETWLQE